MNKKIISLSLLLFLMLGFIGATPSCNNNNKCESYPPFLENKDYCPNDCASKIITPALGENYSTEVDISWRNPQSKNVTLNYGEGTSCTEISSWIDIGNFPIEINTFEWDTHLLNGKYCIRALFGLEEIFSGVFTIDNEKPYVGLNISLADFDEKDKPVTGEVQYHDAITGVQSCEIDFGDDTFESCLNSSGVYSFSHQYNDDRNVTITIELEDEADNENSTNQVVSVANVVPWNLAVNQSATEVNTNDVINFGASAEDVEADNSSLVYSWNFNNKTIINGTQTNYSFSTAGNKTIILTVYDDSGFNSTIIYVNVLAPVITDTVTTTGGSSSCTYNQNYDWQCSPWSECIEGEQTRVCSNTNNCGSTYGRPSLTNDNCTVVINAQSLTEQEKTTPPDNSTGTIAGVANVINGATTGVYEFASTPFGLGVIIFAVIIFGAGIFIILKRRK